MSDMPPVTQVFALAMELAIARKMPPANTVEGCMQISVDERWHITFNGHRTAQDYEGMTLEPFHSSVTYNGWPAGIFSPFGGMIAAGSGANEHTLITALKTATAAAQGATDGN